MLGLLVWQVPSFEADELVPEWTSSTPWWLLGASVLTLAAIVLSSMRWQAVLTALGVRSHLGHLIKHYLAGQFVANVLPTTIGGDVLRVSRLSRENGETPASSPRWCSSGSPAGWCCPVITYFGFAVNPGLTHLGHRHQASPWRSPPVTLVLLVVVLGLVASHRFGGRSTAERAGAGSPAAVHLGLERLRRHPAAAANVLAVGFAYQLVLVLAALFAAKAVGMGVEVGPDRAARLLPRGRHRPGAAHRHLRARHPRGRVRPVPRPARRAHRAGRRPRPPAVPAEPRRQPARRPGLRVGGRSQPPASHRALP